LRKSNPLSGSLVSQACPAASNRLQALTVSMQSRIRSASAYNRRPVGGDNWCGINRQRYLHRRCARVFHFYHIDAVRIHMLTNYRQHLTPLDALEPHISQKPLEYHGNTMRVRDQLMHRRGFLSSEIRWRSHQESQRYSATLPRSGTTSVELHVAVRRRANRSWRWPEWEGNFDSKEAFAKAMGNFGSG
jgi:hypothetical protein